MSDVVFSPSTPNDLWQEVTIGTNLYGNDDIVPYKTLLEWNDINDEICMSLKYRNKVVGYSSLMPIDEDIIKSLVQDEIRERELPLSSIKQWSEPNLSVYICSVTVKPTGHPTRDAERAAIIIKNMIKWALSLDRQYRIKNWYGIGATKEGQHLFTELGFHETISLHNGARKGYYLDNLSKPAKLIHKIMQRQSSGTGASK